MADKVSPNKAFQDYMRSLEPEKEKNNKLSVVGSAELEEENAASTEELNSMIKAFNSATQNTEVATNIEEQNIQTTLQEQANEEAIKKENEARFLAEQEQKRKREEEERLAEEEAKRQKEEKRKFSITSIFRKKPTEQVVETPIDVDMGGEEIEKDVTPKHADEKGVPILKKERSKIAKAFAAPKSVAKPKPADEDAVPKAKPEEEIDWQYLATHDEMTNMLNNKAFELQGNKTFPTFGVVVMDINNLRYINKRFSREDGDKVIMEAVNSFKDNFEGADFYRIDGDEFIAVITTVDAGKIATFLKARTRSIEHELEKITEKDLSGPSYSVSIGYMVAEDKETVRSVTKKARALMEQEKAEYHQNHPEFSMDDNRIPEKTEEEEKELIISEADYNDTLTEEQVRIKNDVATQHQTPSDAKIRSIVKKMEEEVFTELSRVRAIVMTSATFNDVFIFSKAKDFLKMMEDMDYHLNVSYIYAITKEGAQYFGPDTYTDDVDEIFKGIGKALRAGQKAIETKRDLAETEAMSIFQNQYSDFPD